jgi:hypothetical protein
MVSFDSPFIVFVAVLAVQCLAAYTGDAFRRKLRPLKREEEREDFDVVRTASLTLLGLIIGFSFSMAVSRYDQRKKLEAEEANAMGTEYMRASLLSGVDASRLRELLKTYCDERIAYYVDRDELRVGQADDDVSKTQAELWGVVARVASAQPTPIVGLVVAGMNDVLNAQGYTQAAWWNRIPFTAWMLMVLIAIACNLLLGYSEHRTTGFLLIFPLVVSTSLFLIADIDSPRAGIIRVHPHNLMSQCKSMQPGD